MTKQVFKIEAKILYFFIVLITDLYFVLRTTDVAKLIFATAKMFGAPACLPVGRSLDFKTAYDYILLNVGGSGFKICEALPKTKYKS